MRSVLALAWCGLLTMAGSASAATFQILPDGTGDFATIQLAVDACVDGDIIELADGTFVGDGNRDVNYGGKALTIRSTSLDPSLCVIDCEGTEADPHTGFTLESGEGAGATLEGVTVINGYGPYGGAVLVSHFSMPTIRNCAFRQNYVGLGSEDGFGGGILIHDGCEVTVTDCEFTDNGSTWNGAGVMINQNCTVTLERCLFTGNSADGPGAAIMNYNASMTTLIDCTFVNNVATGLYGYSEIVWSSFNNSSLVIRGCTFYDNHSNVVVNFPGGPVLTIKNTLIAFNDGAAFGGGLAPTTTLGCTDVYGNSGGDWVAFGAGYEGHLGNFSADPLFIDAAGGDLGVLESSPCCPLNHPDRFGCALIGAHPGYCDIVGVDEPVAEIPGLWIDAAPSPFRSSVRIEYASTAPRPEIDVFDVAGTLIRSFVPEASEGAILWDGTTKSGTPCAAGTYFVRIGTGREAKTGKIVLLR